MVTSCEIQRPTIVDKNTAGNIVAKEDAKMLPVAESPTPARMAKKARVPRMQMKTLGSIKMIVAKLNIVTDHSQYIYF